MAVIDEIGNKYGRLTVIARNGSDSHNLATWLCQCECGNQSIVRGTNLRRGHTKSCGCLRKDIVSNNRGAGNSINETGNIYGDLTVVDRAGSADNGSATWLCQCKCGNTVVARGSDLRRGYTVSCGCRQSGAPRWRNDNKGHDYCRLEKGKAAFNYLLCRYRSAATRRGYSWELDRKQFKKLTSSNCYYCGRPPEQVISRNDYYGDYVYNGVDRKDNDIGYLPENVVPCCGDCNRFKGVMHHDRFTEMVTQIAKNLIK